MTMLNGKKLSKGDHLITKRFGYTHHGIYIGGGKVVHYAGFCTGLKTGKIEVTSFTHFCQGKPTWVKAHPNRKFTVPQIMKRARSRLYEDKYHLLTNNCEHFINWCLYDKHVSEQVNRVSSITAFALPPHYHLMMATRGRLNLRDLVTS